MRTQIILTALLASLVGSGAQAQEPRDFSLLATQTVQLPGTTYSIVFNSPELQVGEPRNTAKLSGAIASWLSANFGMPAIRQMPQIAYGDGSTDTVVYDSRSHTIYLPAGWNGTSPVELSGFVRAMVQHLEGETGTNYQCTSNLADAVENRWLSMFSIGIPQVNATGSSPGCTFRQSQLKN